MVRVREEIGEKIERKFKFIPMRIYLSSEAIKRLIENGIEINRNKFDVEVRISWKEFRDYNIKNNVLIAKIDDEDIRLVPIKIRMKYRYESIREIKEFIKELEEIKKILKNEYARFLVEIGGIDPYSHRFFVNIDGEWREIKEKYFEIDIRKIMMDYEKLINNFILKNGRFPNEDEAIEMLLKYLSSYNVFEEIDEMLNKLNLEIIRMSEKNG